MKFTLDQKVALSHLVLQDHERAMKISETPQWKDNETLEAKLTINGVAVPAQALEDLLHEWYEAATNKAANAVDEAKFNQRVEEKALELIKNHAGNVLEKISDLEQILSCPENIITPSWERT